MPNRQVTLAEAAEILGLSLHQVRRRIPAGELDAERVERPQGYTYLVTLPDQLPLGAQDSATSQVVKGPVAPCESDRLTSHQIPHPISRHVGPGDAAFLRAPDMIGAKDRQLAGSERRIARLEESRFPLAGPLGFSPAQPRTVPERIKLLETPKEATSPVESTPVFRRWWRFRRRD